MTLKSVCWGRGYVKEVAPWWSVVVVGDGRWKVRVHPSGLSAAPSSL